LLLAVKDDPQSTTAWEAGAEGEERVGALLDRLSSERIKVLHDRRIPGSRANIDHLVVAPSGIHVIDSKKYAGRPERRAEGGIFRPRVERLFVGGRDRTTAVEGVLRQVEVVRTALSGATVPISGYLCFVDADWPLLEPAFSVRRVTVLRPKRLKKVLGCDGPVSPAEVDRLHRALAWVFPPA